MTHGSLHTVLRYLRRLTPDEGGAGGPGDAQLLKRYLAGGDEGAFAAIVRRHGPMVWGVCTRLLAHGPDAEDAFQATFLVLVRKAGSLHDPAALGPWLYGVAYRTAVKARCAAARRQARETTLPADPAGNAPDPVWQDLRPVLDEEVNRLPDKYRAPFLLCYLEGVTNEEAARRLACPKGTVLSRLARARERLRERLTRRGVGLSGALLAAVLARHGEAAVPAALADTTTHLSVACRAGKAAGGVSAQAAALAEGVLRSMFMTQLKMAAVLVLALVGIGSGVGVLTHRSRAEPPQPAAKVVKPAGAPAPAGGAGKKDAAPANADKEAPPAPDGAAERRSRLAQRVKFLGFDDPKITLQEALENLGKRYGLEFHVNEKAFKADELPDVLKTEIAQPNPIPGMDQVTLATVLQKVLSRVPSPSGALYRVHEEGIEITTAAAVREELGVPADRPLLPLVWQRIDGVPLATALRDLASSTNFDVVLDPRVEAKAKAEVTLLLRNVPLDTAVRLLANMADLHVVRLDNVFYVTSHDNAALLRAEQAGNKPPPKPAPPAPGAKKEGKPGA